jgi:uncharacterized protein YabE (DUF348 family)
VTKIHTGERAAMRRSTLPKPRGGAVRWTAKIAAVALAGAALTGFAATHKTVTLNVNGQVSEVTTFGGSVKSVLASQGIEVTERDLVIPGVDSGVPKGGQIVVRTARPMALTIDGESKTIWTTAPTVEEALADRGVRADQASLSVARSASVARLAGVVNVSTPKALAVKVDGATIKTTSNAATVGQALDQMGVILGPNDVVTPAPAEPTEPGQQILIDRAVVQSGSETQALEFKQVKQNDPNLTKGEEKVKKPGKAGQRLITYTATVVGGKEIVRTVLFDMVIADPVDEVIAVGTKEKPKVPTGVNINVDPSSSKGIAKQMAAANYGWGDDEFACLVSLWQRESGWNHTSLNRSSGAYGIPQALPGSKMASAGADWQTNPATQIAWGLGYIKGRYGTPCGAWAHFGSHNWY